MHRHGDELVVGSMEDQTVETTNLAPQMAESNEHLTLHNPRVLERLRQVALPSMTGLRGSRACSPFRPSQTDLRIGVVLNEGHGLGYFIPLER